MKSPLSCTLEVLQLSPITVFNGKTSTFFCVPYVEPSAVSLSFNLEKLEASSVMQPSIMPHMQGIFTVRCSC